MSSPDTLENFIESIQEELNEQFEPTITFGESSMKTFMCLLKELQERRQSESPRIAFIEKEIPPCRKCKRKTYYCTYCKTPTN